MKKAIIFTILILSLVYFFLVQRINIGLLEEAVVIKKPWFWGKKGVEEKPKGTGTLWAVASTKVKIISLKPFVIKESFSELFTEDNVPINLELTFTFRHKRGGSVILLKRFGEENEWYKKLLFRPLQNDLELAIRKKSFKNIREEIKEIKESIRLGIIEFLNRQGIPVELMEITFGQLLPPQEIVSAAIQREVEKEKLKSEKLRKRTIETSVRADIVYMEKMNMSPREYLKMKQIELEREKLSIQRLAIEKAKDSNGSIKIEIKMKEF